LIILDTDHFIILQIGKGASYDALSARMDASRDHHFSTTVVTFEEHMRGWLAGIRRARDITDQVRPYDQLIKLVRFFQAWEILVLTRIPPLDFAACDTSVCELGPWT
jgi:hypothetical protein